MTDGKIRVWVWVAVLNAAFYSAHGLGWGSSSCSIKEDDIKKLEQLCTKTAEAVDASVSDLERKLDRVLSFVEEMKKHESSWIEAAFNVTKGTVERDVSNLLLPSSTRNDTGMTRGESPVFEGPQAQNESAQKGQNSSRGQQRQEEEKEDEYKKEEEEDEDEGEVKKGECKAQVIDNHETIGLFYMTSFRHGHCANRHPITTPVRHCFGYCATRTFIERDAGIWSQGNRCQSCQVDKLETIRIPLSCDDGFSFEKAFENVVSCRCHECKPHRD